MMKKKITAEQAFKLFMQEHAKYNFEHKIGPCERGSVADLEEQ